MKCTLWSWSVSSTRLQFGAAIFKAALVAAVLLPTATHALEFAPYTVEAARKIDRASETVERPPASNNQTENVRGVIRWADQIYTKAGYSLDKSLIRYWDEMETLGRPPMRHESEALYVITAALIQSQSDHVSPDAVLNPLPAKRYRAMMAALKTKEDGQKVESEKRRSESLAAVQSRQAAEAQAAEQIQVERQEEKQRQAEERREAAHLAAAKTAAKWAQWIPDRYTNFTADTFLDVSYVADNVFQVSGEKYQKDARGGNRPSTLCKLPATDVPVLLDGDRLVGKGSAAGCTFSLDLRPNGKIQFVPTNSPACNALCVNGIWTSLSLESKAVRERYLAMSREDNNAAMTPEQNAMQEELARREQGNADKTAASSQNPTTTVNQSKKDDPQKAIDAAKGVLQGLFKKF